MNSKQNVYYVYELIDPRNDTVFYVGLSNQFSEKAILDQDKYKRVKYHGIFRSKSWWDAYKTKKKHLSHKENIIRNCINEGLEIKFAIVKDFMSEREAKELEIKLIKELGRADIEGGVLANISIGGDHVNQHPKKCVHLHYVNPKYTSRTCPVCGHIDKRNREGTVFKCVKCGFEDNADINAAKNILKRFHQENSLLSDIVPDSTKTNFIVFH